MKNNNTILVGLSIIILLIIAGFFYVSDKEKDINNEDQNIEEIIVKDSSNNTDLIIETNLTGGLENKEEKQLSSKEIAIKMESLIDTFEETIIKHEGVEGKLYKGLQEDYFDNYNKKETIDNMKKYIKENKKIKKQVEISVSDFEDKKPIEGADIYLWGLWIGQTDKDGNLNTEISIPKDLSFYYIHISKKGYIGGFKHINSFIHKEDEINQYVELKKTVSKISEHNNINITNNDYKIILKGECNFETADGKCYSGKVNVNIGYISANEVSSLALPMTCLPNNSEDSIYELESAGMDFTTFYDEKGNQLKYTKKNKIKICHYISLELQKDVEEVIKQIELEGREVAYDDIWNYRWFDKTKGIWIPDEDAKKTIDGNYQCYLTFNL